MKGLEEPTSGHVGALNTNVYLRPKFWSHSQPLLVIEQKAPNKVDPTHLSVERSIIAIKLEVYQYGEDQIGLTGLNITAATPVSESQQKLLATWHSQIKNYVNQRISVSITPTNSTWYDQVSNCLVISPQVITSESALKAETPTMLSKLLQENIMIDTDTQEGVEILLKLQKFVRGEHAKMLDGGDWWGHFAKNPVNNLLLLEEYRPRIDSKDAWKSGYVGTIKEYLAGIETAAALFPEEFKKRFFALPKPTQQAVSRFISEVLRPSLSTDQGKDSRAFTLTQLSLTHD